MRFRDKVVIVTGAASGFGRTTAARFAEEGARVVIADVDDVGRPPDGRPGRGRRVRGRGGRRRHLDLGRCLRDGRAHGRPLRRHRRARQQRRHRPARLHRLLGLHRGGVGPTDPGRPEERLPVQQARDRARCAHAGRGAIVNISSIAASVSIGGAAYAAAKGGIVGYTRHVAPELAPLGIRMNCVAPGFMRTPMATGERHGLTPERAGGAARRPWGQRVPMGHTGSTFDIAEAVLFLASDEAGYVTGQELDRRRRLRRPLTGRCTERAIRAPTARSGSREASAT